MNRFGHLGREEERAKRRMDNSAAGDFAIGSVGDLGLDAGAEIAAVVVCRQRDADRCLAVRIKPQRSLGGLVVAVPVTTLAAFHIVVPSER